MNMRSAVTTAGALALCLLVSPGTHADPGNGNGFGNGDGGGKGHNNPAPAPLLAAGVPAFVALGGGVAVRRLIRKLKRVS
jgi:hypothetical protein